MQRSTLVSGFVITLASILATLVIFAQTPHPVSKPAAHPSRQAAVVSASLQTYRIVGKAYFEQGKYTEAIEQFQKVVASGKALAIDHQNLGMALMQANKLDA